MLMEEERGLRGDHDAPEVYASAIQAVVAAHGVHSPLLEDIQRIFDVDFAVHTNTCAQVCCVWG